jgi:two-component system response regulator AtoC
VVLARGDAIDDEHLVFGAVARRDNALPIRAPHERGREPAREERAQARPADASRSLRDVVGDEAAAVERKAIVDALDACNGNQTRAAAKLGIARRTLIDRIERYNLPRPRKS